MNTTAGFNDILQLLEMDCAATASAEKTKFGAATSNDSYAISCCLSNQTLIRLTTTDYIASSSDVTIHRKMNNSKHTGTKFELKRI
ncbi:3-phosphoinositide-dependent protein kinase B-like [Dorcoceras hygrometricum]|uniref:3-phosphoinositide-dependent protein kinase B-like n=1 Tax=Dorcoceras hygrometricum TaxID=472368 RepID=A0A2Z7B7A7_9LAMI|nr:3-phosphoinositide-dependent protein kinase B-like [Dorcoceras hygrometricum]